MASDKDKENAKYSMADEKRAQSDKLKAKEKIKNLLRGGIDKIDSTLGTVESLKLRGIIDRCDLEPFVPDMMALLPKIVAKGWIGYVARAKNDFGLPDADARNAVIAGLSELVKKDIMLHSILQTAQFLDLTKEEAEPFIKDVAKAIAAWIDMGVIETAILTAYVFQLTREHFTEATIRKATVEVVECMKQYKSRSQYEYATKIAFEACSGLGITTDEISSELWRDSDKIIDKMLRSESKKEQ